MARILIVAGGTGGHVYPGLAVAERLRQQGHELHWLGTRQGLEARVVPPTGIHMAWMQVSGLRGKGLWSRLRAPWMLLRALLQAWRIVRHIRPDVVLGMGGFVSGPAGMVAVLMRIPLVVHEQNRVPGTTNRTLARFATRVLQAFPGSFPEQQGALTTGNPLRAGMLPALAQREARAASGVRHILIVGGSLGAQWLNTHVPNALAQVQQTGHRLVIRHQTGRDNADATAQHYRSLQVQEVRVNAYIEDMQAAYEWADLVICRSGAMTVSELAAAAVPSVLVPYPHAIDDHQTRNAAYLAEAGAAVMMPQSALTPELLAAEVTALLDDAERLRAMSRAAHRQARADATDVVAATCIEVIRA